MSIVLDEITCTPEPIMLIMAWLTALGIPAAAYVMCIVALFFDVNEQPRNALFLLGAGLLTAGVYAFHRTTIISIEPMQERHRIAIRNTTLLRIISFCFLVLAMAAFALHNPLATLLVFSALAGVFVYGRKTLIKPLRLFACVKPIAVGVSIALLAWSLNDFSNSMTSLLAFMLMCSADALVCDLVDCEYDAATGCQTLAQQLGEKWTWIVATAVYCFASIGLLWEVERAPVGLYFFIVYILSFSCMRLDPRYVVDLRPILVLLLVWAECLFWSIALG